MLSEKGLQHYIAAEIDQGIFDYVTNPFSIPNLTDRIKNALASVGIES